MIKHFSGRLVLLSLVVYTLCGSTLYAQSKGTVRGIVTDSTSGEALAYCNIFIEELNIGTSTDSRGIFIIRAIPSNKPLNLLASYVGFKTKNIKFIVSKNKITHLDIMLSSKEFELQTIEKVGKKIAKENETDVGLHKITIRDIENLPKGIESDILRSLQHLPGVRSAGDISARYYVRGGASNQNLVMLNSIPIYNPFHALGMFSVIDPDIINNAEFHKGGFPAELAGRLSTVLNVVTKDGNKNNYTGTLGSSFLTAKAVVQGPIPHGSFILSARKSHSNKILNKFNNSNSVPADFGDATFKINYENDAVLQDGRFTLLGFYSHDKIENNDQFLEDYEWTNKAVGINYFQLSGGPLFYEIKFFVTQFEGELFQKKSAAKYRWNRLTDFTIQSDFTYIYSSKDELSVGVKIMEIATDLKLENRYGAKTFEDSKGANISIYMKYKLLRLNKLKVDFGTRLNLTRLSPTKTKSKTFEPRINLNYRLSTKMLFKAAWGIYNQELTTISDENEIITIFEPWVITPNYLNPASASHYIAGFEIEPLPNFNLEFESYYKWIDNLPFVNENKKFTYEQDLVTGTGEAYGFETLLQYQKEPIRFTTAYSYGKSFKELNGNKYHPRYDARHTFNQTLEVNLGAGFLASATWFFSSGTPYSPVAGYYEKYLPYDFSPFELLNSYAPQTIYAGRNISRLPNYHRLDISLSKKMKLFDLQFYFDASILNVYDRKNIFYFKITGERVNMLPFLPTATVKVEL